MFTRNRLAFLFIVILLAFGLTAAVPFQDTDPGVLPGEVVTADVTLPTNLFEFAGWLGLNGLTIAALLEKFGPYQSLPVKTKNAVAFVLALVAPYLGEGLTYLLTQVSADNVAQVQHYLDLALKGLYLYGASQYAHGGLRQFLPAPK